MLTSSMNLRISGALSGAGRMVGLMASWLREGKQPPQAALEIIVGYLHRVACPTYLGAISLFIGWSLDRTQQMLETLQDHNVVVPLTPEEKKQQGFRSDANVWRLVEEPTPAKARW
jgi:hypothetical protein